MNKEIIKEKASYFFTCQKDGFTKDQKQEFEFWINENNQHKIAFENVKKLDLLYSSISKNIKEDISKEVHQDIQKAKSFKKLKFTSLAASVILVLFIGLFALNEYQNFRIKHSFETNNIVQNILLPDGTTILLDAKTKANIKYFEDRREVNLDFGKALFDVAKNPNKPFIINANDIKVQVLGTNFEVRNQKNNIVIDVISGKVSIQKFENDKYKELAILTQGKHLAFDKQNNKYKIKDIDVKNIASWKDGIIVFQDDNLENAIEEFKKYKNLNVFIDKNVQKFSVSGSFKIEEFDKFLFALSKIYSLKVDKRGEIFYISKKI